MGIRNLYDTLSLRFFSNPHSSSSTFFFSQFSKTTASITPLSNCYLHFSTFHSSASPNSSFSPSGCSSIRSTTYPFANFPPFLRTIRYFYIDGRIRRIYDMHLCLKLNLPRLFCTCRHFSSYPYSFCKGRPYASPKQVSEIIDLIRQGVNDLGSKLNMMNVALSMTSTVEILHILARERVSALGFFHWLKASHPELCSHPEIGNLVVNNCGLMGNFDAMVPILTEFNVKRIHLQRTAFQFLLFLNLDKDSTIECVKKIMNVLNEVGGICESIGVQLLVEMFSVSDSFDIAEFFIGTGERKLNHYDILLRAMCRRNDYERAWDLLKEMKIINYYPDRTTYNLLVSCLCKNAKFDEALQIFESMGKDYAAPDASTFDILINSLCKHHQFDLVVKSLDKMTLKGIEPRISTHAAIIKCYFGSGKYEEAHQYVVESAVKQSFSSNANYNLLASLYLKKGNLLLAQKILYEMMDKGLKPNFSVYMKIRKHLQKENKIDLSSELLSRYSSLIEK